MSVTIASWRFLKSSFTLLVLLFILAVAILFSVKNWSSYFFTGLAYHWDPQIMGEWMAWNARNILNGNFLVPDYNINFFYPHSYGLAFSELLWPESFVYTFFYYFTANPFFSFNVTMLFFWALSGVFFFILLRFLDISPVISALGSFVYCLMPYRMVYYVEFNMVLVFIFPLMVYLLIRWIKEPSIQNGLWFSFGYFISATSCLYYTIMAIIIMFFVVLAFLGNDLRLCRNRRYYSSGAVIACCSVAISVIYLYPYALLRIQGGYKRSTTDYMQHFSQPIHYLETTHSPLLRWIQIPEHHFTETILFPGTVLALLAVLFFVHHAVARHKAYSMHDRNRRYIGYAKLFFWVIFWPIVLIQTYVGPVAWLEPINPGLYYVAYCLIILYIVGLFFRKDTDQVNQIVLAGLSAAAVVAFFISLGPFINVGPDESRLIIANGPFQDLASWNPLFSAVRALSRFSIVVLTYLAIAGCYTLDVVAQKNKQVILMFPALVAVLIYEARDLSYEFVDWRYLRDSEVIQKADDLAESNTLFMLPIGIRVAEGEFVMTSIGKFPKLINGWSGFIPGDYEQLCEWEKGGWQLDKVFQWVREVWPPAVLVLNKKKITEWRIGLRQQLPLDELDKSWNLVADDERFGLYRQKQEVLHASSFTRRVRTDMLRSHPVLCFEARTAQASTETVVITLNRTVIKKELPFSNHWQEYQIHMPVEAMGNIEGEKIVVRFVSSPPASWELRNIDFRTHSLITPGTSANEGRYILTR